MKSIFLGILFVLTSCSTTQITGQYVDDKDLTELQSNAKDKNDVLKILGSPTFVPDMDDNTWYYISRNLKTSPMSRPKLSSQRVVKVSFDRGGKVISAELKDDVVDTAVRLDNATTYTQGKQETSLQHFIKNFGRFNIKREKKR